MKLFKKIKDPRIALFAAPLILLSPVYLTGKALFWGTPATQFVPWWNFAWSSILTGQFPFWNPMLGMGAPLVANYQSALFYPPTWIYFLTYALGGIRLMSWGMALGVCFHLIWAGLGTARMLRELKVNRLGQVVGGLAYSLSGYLVARAGFLSINAAAAWIPWLLVCIFQLAGKKPGSFIKLSAVLSMLFLAGHAQTAFYGILLGGAWSIYWALIKGNRQRRFQDLGQMVVKFLGAGLWAVGISAVQLFPTGEYLLLSQRAAEYGYEQAMTYSFWPWRFLTYLLPNLFGNPAAGNYWGYANFWEDAVYIGLLPIILALGFLIRSRRINSRKRDKDTPRETPGLGLFLGAIIVVSFVLALGKNTPIFPFLYKNIPLANLFQAPTRHTIMAEISLAILAGLGANQLAKPSGKRLYFLRLAAAGCLAIIGGALLAQKLIEGLEMTFFTAAAWAGLIGLLSALLILSMPPGEEKGKIENWNVALVCLLSLDLISAGWGLNPGIATDFYTVEATKGRVGRVWMPAEIEYDLKFNRFLRFDTFEPAEEWESMHRVLLPNLPLLQGIEMVNNFDPLVPGIYQDWIDGINSQAPNPQILQMMNVGGEIGYDDQERITVRDLDPGKSPVWLTGCAKVLAADQINATTVLNSEENLLENILVVSGEEIDCQQGSAGTLAVTEKRNGYLKLQIDLEQPSWLIWSQTWYPGWKYKLDGKMIGQTYRANYLFQAVPIDQKTNVVEIIYRPDSIIWGSVVSGVSLLFLLIGLRKRKGSVSDTLVSKP
jgi:hypothetical protein